MANIESCSDLCRSRNLKSIVIPDSLHQEARNETDGIQARIVVRQPEEHRVAQPGPEEASKCRADVETMSKDTKEI